LKKLATCGLIALLLLMIPPSRPAFAQETYDWQGARPSSTVDVMNDHTDYSQGDDVASVGLGVHIARYDENHPIYDGNDVLWLRLAATANTREIITYGVSTTSYTWYTVNNPTGITGDNDVKFIPFYYPIRFYGGRRSAEYEGAYVCSNGFVTFDAPRSQPYYGRPIPSEDEPNTFVAPFWTDLKPNQGGSITWGYVGDFYVISWNNVPNKYGTPQSFQMTIEAAPGGSDIFRNSDIRFSYQSVTLEDQTTVGIEDQRGLRGVSYNSQSIVNGMSLRFRETSNHAFIQYLTIKLDIGDDDYAWIDIDEDPDYITGKNVELISEQPSDSLMYVKAVGGISVLLLEVASLYPPFAIAGAAGFILGKTLLGLSMAEVFARSLSKAQPLEIVDFQPESYIKVEAVERSFDPFTCVDAEISANVRWRFTDPNNRDHDITVTAELTYAVFDDTGALVGYETIPTSVDLNCFIPYHLTISADYGGTTTPTPGTYPCSYGASVTVLARPYNNYDLEYWELDGVNVGSDNPYIVTMYADHNLKAWFEYTGPSNGNGGGGGCPYVSTWDGTDYLLDNNLLPGSETSSLDVMDYYRLHQLLGPDSGGTYKLLFSEFENEHSFFDYAQLVAIDHSSDVNVAVSPYGEILTYAEPSTPKSAIDGNQKNVKHVLSAIDHDCFHGHNGSYVTLNFGDELDVSNGAKLVMRADFPPEKCAWSIHAQVQDENGNWNTVAAVHSRAYWATEIINLSAYLPDVKGNLKVRLYFTAEHKIDFVGLDTSPQATTDVHVGQLISAVHSTNGDVTAKLVDLDETHAELVPEQEIELAFALPPQTMEIRDYVIIVEGHYFAIT